MSSMSVVVKEWAAWKPGTATRAEWHNWAKGGDDAPGGEAASASSSSPTATAVPPMLRRRLSSLGHMALAVAMPLLNDYNQENENEKNNEKVACVFCSRHGELTRTVGLLQSLAASEDLSPMHFSLSVHNAIGGILSIARKDPSAITALASHDSDVAITVMEAAAMLQEGHYQQVLCVIYDQPLPDVYVTGVAEASKIAPAEPYALALLLTLAGREDQAADGLELSLSLSAHPTQTSEISASTIASEASVFGCIRFLLETEQGKACSYVQASARHLWTWRYDGGRPEGC